MKLYASTVMLALLASTSLALAQTARSPGAPSQPSTAPQSVPGMTAPAPGAVITSPSPSQNPGSQGPLATADQNEADLDRKIAQIKSQLQLSDTQQSHWTAAESAIRDMLKLHQRAAMRTGDMSGPSTDRIEQMRRMGQMMSERGAAMTRLADAAKPLYDSLSEDQRRRLHGAVHDAMMQEHGRMGGMMRGDMRGEMRGEMGREMGRHGDHHRGRDFDNHGYRGDGDRYGRSYDRYGRDYPRDERYGSDRGWNQRNWDNDDRGRGDNRRDYGGARDWRGDSYYGRGERYRPYDNSDSDHDQD